MHQEPRPLLIISIFCSVTTTPTWQFASHNYSPFMRYSLFIVVGKCIEGYISESEYQALGHTVRQFALRISMHAGRNVYIHHT